MTLTRVKFTLSVIMGIFVIANLYIIHTRAVQRAELIGFVKGASTCIPLENLIEPETPEPTPLSKA
jgi:hypothetical protein